MRNSEREGGPSTKKKPTSLSKRKQNSLGQRSGTWLSGHGDRTAGVVVNHSLHHNHIHENCCILTLLSFGGHFLTDELTPNNIFLDRLVSLQPTSVCTSGDKVLPRCRTVSAKIAPNVHPPQVALVQQREVAGA